MAKRSKNFVVPKELQHDYKMLIQRANRRVKSNLKYITQNQIRNEHTQRSLVGGFNDPEKWASGRMPFSRSTKGRYVWDANTGTNVFKEFTSQKDFEMYLNHVKKWGAEGTNYRTNPKVIKANYKKNIIITLNAIKDHYNIPMKGGRIPKEVIDALDTMTMEQITNFYGMGDIEEDVEISQLDSDDYANVVDAQGFIDVTMSRIGAIKKFY